jgi:hypothetical protein
MKQLVEFPLESGGTILVEVDLPEAGIEQAGRGDTITRATQTLSDALEQIKPASEAVVTKLRALATTPDEISVTFGIKLSAKAGAIIASTDAEANFTVSLKWKSAPSGS